MSMYQSHYGSPYGLNPMQFHPQAQAQAFRAFQGPQHPQQPQRQALQVEAYQVGSADEARAAMVNPVGLTAFYSFGEDRIYVKRIGNDGRAEMYTFALELPAANATAQTSPLDTINQRLERIENAIGGLAHVQSNAIPTASTADTANAVLDPPANVPTVGNADSAPGAAPKSKRDAGGKDA